MSIGKLIYFPVMAKGLQLALIAEHSGLAWEGKTAGKGEGPEMWPGLKSRTPFGQMPFLETPEHGTVGQSTAIANYIGSIGNMTGANPAELAKGQMCMAEGEDLYSMMMAKKFQRWRTADDKCSDEEVAQYWNESVPAHIANLEALCGETGFTSSGRTAGELYLWGVLYQMSLMNADFLAAFPKVAAWFGVIGGDAATKKVCEGRSAIGELGQYFVNNQKNEFC